LRQRKARFTPEQTNASRRLSAAVSLAVSLVLWLLPFVTVPVAAAPPEPIREATSEITPESPTATDSPRPVENPQLRENLDQLVADVATRDGLNGGDGSVRPRGMEAPVQLERKEAQGGERRQDNGKSPGKQEKGEKVEPDPGDGPVRNRQDAAKKREQGRTRELARARERGESRIWPMPAKSYTFTQQFGCVPQLGNLYFPGEGCPAGAPVIHTGVDLAAPEGTPFYAAASGWVTLADYDRPTADANTRIIIQHEGRNEGYATDYLHWVASYVEEGDYVHAGDPIGEVGNVGFSTGPHLHFSVTDLDTGEFIDPLRWLPDEPGLKGYVSRRPSARLRLPPGTTAGQPEAADPAPPPPPVKEKVPKSPSGDGNPGKSDEGKRGGRDAKAGNESAANDAKRSGKKPSRRDPTSETKAAESTSDAKNDRHRTPSREPSRERKKDESPPAEAPSGDENASRDKRSDSSRADRRANREASKEAGNEGKEEPTRERSERSTRDSERNNSTGHGERGGRDERGADRKEPNQGKPDGGSNNRNRERHRKS
jgi:murein DD-endopeptidase MepM/ murein hydrolase activator NlpD